MTVGDLIKLLQELPQGTPIIANSPDASDEGLGHWYVPQFLHLNGYELVDLKDGKCLKFKYGKEDEGWTDDCWDALDDGRFFEARGLGKDDFVWAGEETPTKDGNYLCVCQHGSRYTLEHHSFFAKVMADGYVRSDGHWGFDCGHIPAQCGRSYPVMLWCPKSYVPFQGGQA